MAAGLVQQAAIRERDQAMVMQCEQIWHEVSNYLEGEVDAPLRLAMDEHFRSCAKCRSVLEGMRDVVRLYGDERMVDLPTGFSRRLEKRIAQQARAERSAWRGWSAWLVPVAALLLIGGGYRVANSLSVQPQLRSEHAQPGKNIPSDMIVVVSADAKEFHVPGCEFIHNKDKERTLTAKQAMEQGYVPCVKCLRKYLETASLEHMGRELEANLDVDGDVKVLREGN